MADPFLGQILLVPYSFAPRNWANCDGTLTAISQNQALFSLIGCVFGGDCRTTFALPDLRGRTAIHVGTGPGLPPYQVGQNGGTPTVTLTNNEIPSHTHSASGTTQATSAVGNQLDPTGRYLAQEGSVGVPLYHDGPSDEAMAAGNVAVTVLPDGGGGSHNNMQPFLTLRYVIALLGVYPSRN